MARFIAALLAAALIDAPAGALSDKSPCRARGMQAACFAEAARHIERKEPISAIDCLLILASGYDPAYREMAVRTLQEKFPMVPLPAPPRPARPRRAAAKSSQASRYDHLLKSVRYTFDCTDLPYNNKTKLAEQVDMDSRIKSALQKQSPGASAVQVAAGTETIRDSLYLFRFTAFLPEYDLAKNAFDLSGPFAPVCGNPVPDITVAFPAIHLGPAAARRIRDSSGGTYLVEWLVQPDRIEDRAGPEGKEDWVLWRLSDAKAAVAGLGPVFMKK
jgi:hypothetical protein